MKKSIVLETLSSLEEEFHTEELIEKILFIEKVEKGLDDVKHNRLQDFNDVRQRFADKWNN